MLPYGPPIWRTGPLVLLTEPCVLSTGPRRGLLRNNYTGLRPQCGRPRTQYGRPVRRTGLKLGGLSGASFIVA
eukprot:4105210-Alexandrium_andersonii.AAC.1